MPLRIGISSAVAVPADGGGDSEVEAGGRLTGRTRCGGLDHSLEQILALGTADASLRSWTETVNQR